MPAIFTSFFHTHTPTTEIYPLSLHDALPISNLRAGNPLREGNSTGIHFESDRLGRFSQHSSIEPLAKTAETRSEEHTSELQSLTNLVCRLLLEKKQKQQRQQDYNSAGRLATV